MLEWVNTSTLSELCSAVNELSRLFNITCNSFAVSDNNIDYMLIRLYDFCEVLALHGQSIISLHGEKEGKGGGVTDCYTYSNIIKYHHSI